MCKPAGDIFRGESVRRFVKQDAPWLPWTPACPTARTSAPESECAAGRESAKVAVDALQSISGFGHTSVDNCGYEQANCCILKICVPGLEREHDLGTHERIDDCATTRFVSHGVHAGKRE